MAKKKKESAMDSRKEMMARVVLDRAKHKDTGKNTPQGWGAFMAGLVAIFALVTYTRQQDESTLIFGGVVIFFLLALPLVIDFIKAAALKGMDQGTEETENSKKVMERVENLEALMCRLDAEINSQLEQTLSAGKITTLENVGNSQMPTIFLNISTALENRFQVLREIGRGGMGIVFQAHDKQLKEQVAIKVLSPLLSNSPDALERLHREVSAARRITHPNVIRIHDISDAGGLHFVSMEYFAGTTLKELVRRNGAFSLAQGAQIAFQICDGLESAHNQGVIHRDLKSQNIIVNDVAQLKIIDFGLASTRHHEGMTATGLILGTPEYMSPEQVSGKKADERADIYSFGIILYELFTGKVPFTGESPIAIGFQQLREEPPKPSELNSQISAALEAVILKAIEKKPMDRYSSVAEMRSALESVFRTAPAQFIETEKPAKTSVQDVIERRG